MIFKNIKKCAVVVVLIFVFLNIYSETKIDNVALSKKISAAIDSLKSPSFDSLYNELKKEADIVGDIDVNIELLQLQVYNFYLKGNTDSLLHYSEIVKDNFLYKGSLLEYYDIWSYVVSHYSLTGKVYKAITESTNMLTDASNHQNLYGMALSRQLLGEIYLYMDLYDESLIQLKKSFEFSTKSENPNHSLSSLCFSINIANIYNQNYDSIFEFCNIIDSLNVISDTVANVLTLKAYNLVSMCCRTIANSRTNNLVEANKCFDIATTYYNECSMQQDFYIESEAVLRFEEGNYRKSLELYEDLYSYYSDLGLQKESLRILKQIAETNGRLGNYAEAFKNYTLYESKKDSLSADMAYQHLNELAISNDLKNIELEKKNLQLDIQKARSTYLTIIIAFFVFISFVILYFYLREKKLNTKLKFSENSLKEEKDALARSEEMLLAALERAKQAEIIKSSFLANISHEIRTPLNSIVGFSDMIIDCDDKNDRALYGEIIKTNNELLLKLIDDIIAISRTEAENNKRNISNFDLVDVFKEQYLKNRNKVNGDVKFINDISYDKMVVVMDKMRVTQILVNFISNAIKFTNTGFIKFGFYPDLRGKIGRAHV